MKKTLLTLVLLTSCLVSYNQKMTTVTSEKKVLKVILIIGDGMGLSQVSSTLYLENEESAFLRFLVSGLHVPSSAKQRITDSAAGATAFASGTKTYNGAISKDTLLNNTETLLERISNTEVATGLVVTSSITHATPACFYAHTEKRHDQDSIASQLVDANVDFFSGGGLQFFQQEINGKNTLNELSKEFEIDTVKLSQPNKLETNKKYGFLLAQDGLLSAENDRGDYLTEASKLATDYLNRKSESTFLMIESSQIDWQGHAANQDGLLAEMKDFNHFLNGILDYAEKDGETLVIVTADHETGGYALAPEWKDLSWDYNTIQGKFYDGISDKKSALAHTGTMVPVFAYGPGSQKFTGVYQNTQIFHKIMEVTGW